MPFQEFLRQFRALLLRSRQRFGGRPVGQKQFDERGSVWECRCSHMEQSVRFWFRERVDLMYERSLYHHRR
jgi:hypothetical protein